jgi:hypothetical protein
MFLLERQPQEKYPPFSILQIFHKVIKKRIQWCFSQTVCHGEKMVNTNIFLLDNPRKIDFYTTACFSQQLIVGRKGKYKRCSSWRDNTVKIIIFYISKIRYRSVKKLTEQHISSTQRVSEKMGHAKQFLLHR